MRTADAPPCSIVTDSAAMLPHRDDGIAVTVPLTITIGSNSYLDGIDINPDEFYRRLIAGEVPMTSTPSPGDYLSAYRAAAGQQILCLTIPPELSGMYEAATIAAAMFAEEQSDRQVTVLDTRTAAAGHGLLARFAVEMAAQSLELELILERLRQAMEDVRMYGSLDTLEYLARSGRVTTLVANVGDLLGVRPVFEMRKGQGHRVGLARGDRRATRIFVREAREQFPATALQILVFHCAAPVRAAELMAELRASCDVVTSELVALTPVMGAYTGPGTIGFAALPDYGSATGSAAVRQPV